MNQSPYSAKDEQQLMIDIWSTADDPEAFVLYNYPWGKPNTPLHDKTGPRTWQRDELQAMKEHIANNKRLLANGKNPKVYQSAIASGRGSGKSAFLSWIDDWHMSTHLGSTTIVTANTEEQLKSRTWAELGKWHTLSLNKHWFDKQALSLRPQAWFTEALKKQLSIDSTYYYALAQTWSEENPDAFAGVHNPAGVLLVFDEASGISEKIWSVSEGFFTDISPYHFWFAFSNPRRNTGSFYECFHKYRDYWKRRHIDSRTVEGIDADRLNAIIEKYGKDSDEAKIEVLGEFPSQGDKQFIARDIVDGARERELLADDHAPLIMGVDPARFGDDKSVIRFRQGRNGRVLPPFKFKGLDNMELANQCAALISKYNPDAIAVDAGNGTGVIDRLREMGYKVHEVWFGSKSSQPEYANKRTEMWADMREWLKGACIDLDDDLKDDLVGPEYGFMGRSDQIMLESKEKMKSRGLHSPDDADALACTFAVKVARRDLKSSRRSSRATRAKNVDYPIFGR